MSTHAKLSPSSAHRWLYCPASVGFVDQLRYEGKLPPEERSEFTDEGTIAHNFAAKALEYLDAGMEFDWETIPDAVMRSHVRAYYDLVTSKITGDGQLFIEHRMPLFYGYRGDAQYQVFIRKNWDGSYNLEPKDARWFRPFATYDDAKNHLEKHLYLDGFWMEECGTSDAIVLNDEALYVIDLKYGQGVSVEAQDNDQLAIYAESFIRQQKLVADGYPPSFKVVPIIFQPRAREGAPVREWFTTLGELAQKTTAMGVKAQKLRDEPAHEFVAGDKQCRFCPARKLCKVYADYCTFDVKEEFGSAEAVESAPAPNELSEADIARIAKVALDGRFVKWLNTVSDYALELRMAGKLSDSGLKIVASTPRRKWADEDAAGKLLRNYLGVDEAQPRGVISPAQAEKALKAHDVSKKFWNKFNGLVTRGDGQPTLALLDDTREEWKPATAASEFGDVVDAGDDLL
jgi:hypothetical protein